MSTPGSVPLPALPGPRMQWTLQPVPKASAKDYAGASFGERYLLRHRIGSGGMSTVYAAMDSTLGKRVAVKILRDDLPSDPVDRFRREAHVLAGLTHEHLAGILDRRDLEDGTRFLVTDYIDGHDLSELCGRGPMPAAVVILIGLQVAAALAYAHDAGVIHRDIKPSNLMLTRHPSGDIFVKVIDFGIAKLAQDSDLAAPGSAPAGARRATRGDVVLGTAPYWCDREGPQADVYALALTLAVLLTGKVPPAGVKVDLAGDTIPRKLDSVLQTALALGDEIATMDALDMALREVNDALDPSAAEMERRRYFTRVFSSVKPAPSEADTAAPSTEAPRFGERFILCGELGQGGMGRVRIVFDTELRRRVALKTIRPQHAARESFKARLRREARALATIDHSGVPKVFTDGNEPEPFFTMEIVVGVPLKAEKRIEPVRALSLAIDLGEILGAAHEAGIVHRDVKPDNILIGKGDRVRLLDFGLCLFLPRYHQRELLFPATPPGERYETGVLDFVGTPGYTAPEILAREGTSTRSDIYSVCAVLYGMLTGRSLLDPVTSTMRSLDRGEFPAALGPIAELLRRGTAREPTDRPRNMADLVAELEILRSGLLRARQRRHLALVVVVTTLSNLSLAALLVLGVYAATAPSPEDSPPVAVVVPAASTTSDPMPSAASPATPTSSDQAAPIPTKPSEEPAVVALPTSPPLRPSLPLTAAAVAEQVGKRRARFHECSTSYHLLRLLITDGRATLADVDGMPFAPSVPVHACLRKKLRQFTFPHASKPAEFMVPLDLRPTEEKPR